MTLTTASWALLALWICGHILLFGILFKRTKHLAVALSVILLAGVYATKPATFDLPRYSVYFETGVAPWITATNFKKEGWQLAELDERERNEYGNFFPHSPAFNFLFDVARNVLPHGSYLPRIITERHIADSLVLLIVISSIVLLLIALALIRAPSQETDRTFYPYVLVIGVTLGSLFFFVGSQNALRQFIGTAMGVLAFAAYVRSKNLLTLIGALTSFLFHPWSPLFLVLGVVTFESRRFFNKILAGKRASDFINEYVVAFLLGIGGVVLIKIGIKLGIPYFTTYFHIDTSGETYRTPALTKLILFAIMLVVTDLIAGTPKVNWYINPISLRRCFLILLAPMVIFPEIFSRLMMFYFAIEMIFIAWAMTHERKRVQLSGCVVFGSYALGLNALNILLDKGWRELLFYAP